MHEIADRPFFSKTQAKKRAKKFWNVGVFVELLDRLTGKNLITKHFNSLLGTCDGFYIRFSAH